MFFIVWGWRSQTKRLSEGLFHCPREGGDRNYWLMEAKRWFTLFWIPVIPLRVLGEYVQCVSCGSTYDPAIRSLPTTVEFEDTLSRAMRRIVVSMIKADGHIADSERRTAVAIIGAFTTGAYSLDNLDDDLGNLDSGDSEVTRLSGLLNDRGKESVVRACVELAGADGALDRSELDRIAQLGRDFGMSPAHVRGILADGTAPPNVAISDRSVSAS